MSQDQGRSSKPTARYESDEAPLLPPAGAGEDDDFVVEAGAFGSGKVLAGLVAKIHKDAVVHSVEDLHSLEKAVETLG